MGGLVARHAGREAINAAMSPLRSPEKEAASREALPSRLADDIAMTTAGMRRGTEARPAHRHVWWGSPTATRARSSSADWPH